MFVFRLTMCCSVVCIIRIVCECVLFFGLAFKRQGRGCLPIFLGVPFADDPSRSADSTLVGGDHTSLRAEPLHGSSVSQGLSRERTSEIQKFMVNKPITVDNTLT